MTLINVLLKELLNTEVKSKGGFVGNFFSMLSGSSEPPSLLDFVVDTLMLILFYCVCDTE